MNKLNWKALYFGPITKDDIERYVHDPDWQRYRKRMKGISLEEKYVALRMWLTANYVSFESQIQVTNYIHALSRGGLIKPEEYR